MTGSSSRARFGIGLKGSEVERVFNSEHGFTFSPGKDTPDGQANRIGKRYGCTVQLIGPVANLTVFGLIVPLSLDDPVTVARARRFLQTFFNQVPGAGNGPAWVEANIFEATLNKDGVKIDHNGLVIDLNGLATKDGLVLTLMVTKG